MRFDKKKPLTALALCAALAVNAAPVFAVRSGADVDLTSDTDAQCRYLPPGDAQTVSYYFAMPREWCTEHTDRAGVNWTYRETGRECSAPVCRVAAGFRAHDTETPLVFRADVPDFLSLTEEYLDAGVGTLTWTNYLSDTASEEFRSVTLDLRDTTTVLTDADSESAERDARLFSHGYCGQLSADDGFWKYLAESYGGDKAALGAYSDNFYMTFENDPEGRLCLRHDGMIYLPGREEWFFLFDGACGTYPTKQDSISRGEYFELDATEAPAAQSPGYPGYADYHGDAPATGDEAEYREHSENVGGFDCFFGLLYNEETDAYDKYVRVDGYSGTESSVTVPSEVKGVPVTDWSLENAAELTEVTIPAALAGQRNREGMISLNCLPKLARIALDGESSLCTVQDDAVYLSDGETTELIAAARQREGEEWRLPEGVDSITEDIACDNVKMLVLPASLQSAEADLSFPSLERVETAETNGSFCVKGGALYHLGADGRPDSLTLVPEKGGMTALDIPEGVRQVGKLRCGTLRSIRFPSTAQTITTFSSDGSDKASLPSLTEIEVAEGNPCFTSRGGVLYGVECGVDEATGRFVATDGGKPAYFAACPESYPYPSLELPESVRGFTEPLGCGSIREVSFPRGWETEGESGDIARFLGGSDVTAVCYPDTAALRFCIEKGLKYRLAGALTGDVNGDGSVNIIDATLTQRIAAEIIAPDENQKAAADVNRDGKIDVADATLIQKIAAEII